MSSSVFGGKMTSTSGKTRQSVTRGVTSNLQAGSSRGNKNAIAVDTVVSDGSVSPFEAVEGVRGSDRVGGGRNVPTSVKDACSPEDQQESVALIVFTHIDDDVTYNDLKDDVDGNDKKYINNNKSRAGDVKNNKKPVNTKSPRASVRPLSSKGRQSVIRSNGINGSGSGLRRSIKEKKVGDNAMKGKTKVEHDHQSRDEDRGERRVEWYEIEEEKELMLRTVCDKCGVLLGGSDGNEHVCSGDSDEKQLNKKRGIFCCCLCSNKVNDGKESSNLDTNLEKNGGMNNSGRVGKSGDKIRRVKVKTKVQFSETKLDSEEMREEGAEVNEEKEKLTEKEKRADIERVEESNDERKAIQAKSKVKVKKRKKRKKENVEDHQHKRVLNMLVFVPSMHLIPDGRRYEDYFKIKPRDDLEFGKKPVWFKPRLMYYVSKMGCGTSNQVISMEGKMPIVVFGATGVIGGSVVRALLKDPRFMVKAVTRTPTTDQARGLAEIGAVVVPADFNDVRSLQRVMEGAAGVFLTTNFWEHLSKQKELNYGMNAIDAAVSCNVHHFIFQGSEHTRDEDKPCGHLNSKAAIEEYVKETSLPYTSIHLPFLYENLLSLFKPHCIEHGSYTIPIPMGDMSMDCMSLHDFARCVVNIFLRPKNHMLKSVQLTGDRMSIQHMADVLNRHFDDRKFVYHKLNPSDFATFDFQGSQDLAAMFEFLQTAPHRDPRITRRIHHSVVCFDKWVADNKHKLVDAMKDTGDGTS